jgi:LacI family transcriptional regulator
MVFCAKFSLICAATQMEDRPMGQIMRIAVINSSEQGVSREILAGVGRFAAARHDWGMRWKISPRDTLEQVANWKPHGIIYISDDQASEQGASFRDVPSVLAGASPCQISSSSVHCDPGTVGRSAVEYFLERGHRHLACMALSNEPAGCQHQGFLDAARREGIEPCSIILSSSSETSSQDVLSDQAAVEWLKNLPHPVGLFVVCSRLAANLCEIARELGIAVPDHLGIIASGNDLAAAVVSRPPLSIVELPLEQIGYQAAQQLAELLAGGAHRQIVLFPHRIVSRRSSESWAVDDGEVRSALEFIRENAHRPIGVRDILDVVPTSRRSLEVRFQTILKRTIAEEIRRAHVQLALRRLRESDASLSDITFSCGLNSITQLGTLIRRYTGFTPIQIRRRAKGTIDPLREI